MCVSRNNRNKDGDRYRSRERERERKHYNQRVSVKGETKGTGGIKGSGDMTVIAVDRVMAKKKLLNINTVQ